jgi:hypothetical protein
MGCLIAAVPTGHRWEVKKCPTRLSCALSQDALVGAERGKEFADSFKNWTDARRNHKLHGEIWMAHNAQAEISRRFLVDLDARARIDLRNRASTSDGRANAASIAWRNFSVAPRKRWRSSEFDEDRIAEF